jgi:N-acyl-D-amino-acid deacylase
MTYDLYCYLAGSTILGMIALPPWVQEGGIEATLARLQDPSTKAELLEGFEAPRGPLENVRLSYIAAPEYRHYEGKTLAEATWDQRGSCEACDYATFICNLLVASNLAVGCVVPHLRRGEEDVRQLMRHPAMMAGSDGIFTGQFPHPRGCGCFARYLGPYVRDARTWSLEEAVQRCSAHAARRYGLKDRGLLRAGMAADVVVFDADQIADRSTYEDGRQLAVGMEHVVVNGQVVLHAGRRTAATPSRALRP